MIVEQKYIGVQIEYEVFTIFNIVICNKSLVFG